MQINNVFMRKEQLPIFANFGANSLPYIGHNYGQN